MAYPGLGADTTDGINPDVLGHDLASLVKAHVLAELSPPNRKVSMPQEGILTPHSTERLKGVEHAHSPHWR